MTGTHHAFPLPPDAEKRVRALLEGALAGDDRRAAMDHLRACGTCRELYDAVASAERALSGGDAVLGPAAMERVAARLEADAPAPPRTRPGWLAWAAAAGATCMVLLGVRAGWQPGTEDEFTPRGGTPAESAGIRLFLLDGTPRELREGDVLRRGQHLGASYSSGSFDELQWFVESGDGSRALLSELDGVVRRGVVDEPLDASLEVDARFGTGSVEVGAVFSGPPDGGATTARRSLRLTVEDAR